MDELSGSGKKDMCPICEVQLGTHEIKEHIDTEIEDLNGLSR